MLAYKETLHAISEPDEVTGRSAEATFDHLVFHQPNPASQLTCQSFGNAPYKVHRPILLNTETSVMTHIPGNIDAIRNANFLCSLN